MDKNVSETLTKCKIDTYLGKKFDVLTPSPGDVDIVDIAHALSMLCRFNGHCSFFYSVAQHCICVSKEIRNAGYSEEYQLYALLHDAAEAYMCDLPKPIKEFLPEYKVLELDLIKAIINGLSLPQPSIEVVNVVREFDKLMLATEAKVLMRKNFDIYSTKENALFKTEIVCRSMPEVENKYLDLYAKLTKNIEFFA
jgi:hypothetical protein